jgi:hypothetical protein
LANSVSNYIQHKIGIKLRQRLNWQDRTDSFRSVVIVVSWSSRSKKFSLLPILLTSFAKKSHWNSAKRQSEVFAAAKFFYFIFALLLFLLHLLLRWLSDPSALRPTPTSRGAHTFTHTHTSREKFRARQTPTWHTHRHASAFPDCSLVQKFDVVVAVAVAVVHKWVKSCIGTGISFGTKRQNFWRLTDRLRNENLFILLPGRRQISSH